MGPYIPTSDIMGTKGRIDRRRKHRTRATMETRRGPSRATVRRSLLMAFVVAALLLTVVIFTSPKWSPTGNGGIWNPNPPPPKYPKPVPRASATPATVFVGQNVSFDASRSLAYSGAYITNFTWQFHNGTLQAPVGIVRYERKFNMSFERPGVYFIVLFVTDSRGMTNNSISTSKYNAISVLVNSRNLVAEAGNDMMTSVGLPVLFNASASSDKNGTIINYTWDFGDGSNGYGVTPTHIYTLKSIYIVVLTVKDDHGEYLQDTLNVVVN